MRNREEIIKIRENKIKDLSTLHIYLNNYRFVLDQKINSLKDERASIEVQNKQIQENKRNFLVSIKNKAQHKTRLISCFRHLN